MQKHIFFVTYLLDESEGKELLGKEQQVVQNNLTAPPPPAPSYQSTPRMFPIPTQNNAAAQSQQSQHFVTGPSDGSFDPDAPVPKPSYQSPKYVSPLAAAFAKKNGP
ncbi:MAG: hypothetical protein A3F13_03890 [Gammaproteobacteria bacterium RIFCSPHIGHO2_12_FULL_40_19]|nr:MAG: hypothetical protein A3F13_03890 [Gammaproteobacteria bacterium RIFCSPHIGHO2_12_FULL_40_19]